MTKVHQAIIQVSRIAGTVVPERISDRAAENQEAELSVGCGVSAFGVMFVVWSVVISTRFERSRTASWCPVTADMS